ncbi:MAG: hypothetical protein ABI539_00910 [Acidobacteriota bacterium]
MDIKCALLEVHSKEQAIKIADYVGSDEQRFAELMKLFTGPVYRVGQRAAWPVSLCIERDPNLVQPYFPGLIKQIERDDAHIAVRRNVLRLLQFVAIPKRYQGRVFDLCYKLFADVSQTVAVRVFAMTVAADLANGDHHLMNELQLVAESHPQLATAGFQARVRRVFGKK